MKGTVYKSTGSWYTVKAEDGQFYQCRIKGKFRIKGIKNTNPVAVGDRVLFDLDHNVDEVVGVIKEIEERENYIIRKSVNLSKQTHIIAANIDIAFLIVTLNNPPTFTTFIDRFLVTAEAYGIKAVLLFNKVDTYTEEEKDEIRYLLGMYRAIGYEAIPISAKTGKNIERVKEMMLGKTSLFSGHSGVGKTTLINQLQPGLSLKTSEISEQHLQGQHTTTFAEMFDLSFDAQIIDTPGIKGFGIVEIEKEELGDYFPEFFKLKEQCKFNNCLHLEEPKCAVKEALELGEIAMSRYKSYLQIIEGEDENYRVDIYKE
ncbi:MULTISPECIES: ribosome small subunit-dependent GTPase A [Mesonia]|uniref:Small ribosomal subunit biogenesis GTPase RsgA n=1 Tax=Mesonia oceanica TaxID=2687242 RepID=A0AC61Y7V3_9FLAO|nr:MULTISPECIES: ribosome small subunit-dependent GTPase A [Mesonia]MBJ97064.1 ribosome small subunit-dependent GTPase A [Flavobacteriaceae bacterium]MAN29458.1 ribosome small subunit-dependent GTPase A [Mesonia sp.]MAQ39437.1 ribosome small subunit-dependent GTPase A [Mesonia sp.]MAQ42112.1 ribosome small subunit-dependent GTPase A [Mesonia sp.]VVV00584.1 Small ribosomal subunit biogenesis GTPase RsgA [Mesonia oceanica]|tara:strand:+ start:9264 stop:10211 length:948 start_codon:yes stop_codon:yes gene_type:complete